MNPRRPLMIRSGRSQRHLATAVAVAAVKPEEEERVAAVGREPREMATHVERAKPGAPAKGAPSALREVRAAGPSFPTLLCIGRTKNQIPMDSTNKHG